MRDLLHKPLFVISGAVILLMAIVVIGLVRTAHAASTTPRSGERLLVIHDDNVEKGFLTRSATVREALEEAKVPIDNNDLVEPSLDETLVASSYDINIYRARPVTVVDGAVRKKIMSAYRTPTQIAAHADIKLRAEDKTEMSLPASAPGYGASIELTITRATEFSLVLYGKKTVAFSQAKTVGDMLEEKKITLAKDDTLSVAVDTPLTAGMTVELWREGTQTVTEDKEVAFDTERIQDADREVGFREVVTPGKNGKRTVTYEIEMKNGVEVGRKEIQSVVVVKPIKQVERVGIKASLPAGSHEDWMAAAGISPSDFGYVNYIVGRESGWGVTKYNYAGSGAYGLCQALPGDKMASAGSDWRTNPITQLKWCNSYAIGRYGSWASAYSFWLANHWW